MRITIAPAMRVPSVLRALAVMFVLAFVIGAVTTAGVTASSASAPPVPDISLAARMPFDFNGVNQGINLGNSEVSRAYDGDFTASVWVRFDSLTNDGPCFEPGCDMSIIDKMANPNDVNSDGWRVLKQSDNRFWFCLGGEAGTNGCDVGLTTTVISVTEAQAGVWYNVTATKDSGVSSALRIYVNGVLEGTTYYTPFTNTEIADLRIGANDPEGAVLHGQVGRVAFFRGHALGSALVLALYASAMSSYR